MRVKPKSSNAETVAALIMQAVSELHDKPNELLKKIIQILEENDFLEWVKFVIQRRNKTLGVWQTLQDKHIQGKRFAFQKLNETKKKNSESEWRAIPKVFADCYKQGRNDTIEAGIVSAAEIRRAYMKGVIAGMAHIIGGGSVNNFPRRKAA